MLALLLFAPLIQTHALPVPTGPYMVGTTTQLFVDTVRHDAVDSTKPQTILVQLWYPTQGSSGREIPSPYLSAATLQALRADKYLNVDVHELDGWDKIQTNSFPNAKAVPKKFPLLLFAPGFGMSRASYTTLAEELASLGIITAIADHPYCGLSIYPDGRLRSYMASKEKAPVRVNWIATDQSFLLRGLTKSPPKGLQIDWAHVFVGGHSIGGAGALQTARTNQQIRGAIDLDGDVWGDVERSGTRKPFLVLLNQPGPPIHISPRMKEERTKEWQDVLAKSNVSSRVIEIGPAYHFTFSDIPFLLPGKELEASGATLEPIRGRNVIAGIIADFMRDDLNTFDTAIKQIPEANQLMKR